TPPRLRGIRTRHIPEEKLTHNEGGLPARRRSWHLPDPRKRGDRRTKPKDLACAATRKNVVRISHCVLSGGLLKTHTSPPQPALSSPPQPSQPVAMQASASLTFR